MSAPGRLTCLSEQCAGARSAKASRSAIYSERGVLP